MHGIQISEEGVRDDKEGFQLGLGLGLGVRVMVRVRVTFVPYLHLLFKGGWGLYRLTGALLLGGVVLTLR